MQSYLLINLISSTFTTSLGIYKTNFLAQYAKIILILSKKKKKKLILKKLNSHLRDFPAADGAALVEDGAVVGGAQLWRRAEHPGQHLVLGRQLGPAVVHVALMHLRAAAVVLHVPGERVHVPAGVVRRVGHLAAMVVRVRVVEVAEAAVVRLVCVVLVEVVLRRVRVAHFRAGCGSRQGSLENPHRQL
jgi:hypothetical protein